MFTLQPQLIAEQNSKTGKYLRETPWALQSWAHMVEVHLCLMPVDISHMESVAHKSLTFCLWLFRYRFFTSYLKWFYQLELNFHPGKFPFESRHTPRVLKIDFLIRSFKLNPRNGNIKSKSHWNCHRYFAISAMLEKTK